MTDDLVEKVARAIMDTQDMGNIDAQAKAATTVVVKDLMEKHYVGNDWVEVDIVKYARENGVSLDVGLKAAQEIQADNMKSEIERLREALQTILDIDPECGIARAALQDV